METRDSPRDNFELGETMVGVVIRIPSSTDVRARTSPSRVCPELAVQLQVLTIGVIISMR